jgi:hypothetical protein
MGPKIGLDNVQRGKFLTLPVLELRFLDRLACRQLQYRLRHRGSFFTLRENHKLQCKKNNWECTSMKLKKLLEKWKKSHSDGYDR